MASASVVLTSDTSGSVTVTVPSGTAIGTTTLTLPTTGGTIQTSGSGYTTNGVAYASSTSALATGSGLTFDGTNLLVGTTSAVSGNIITANISNNGLGGIAVKNPSTGIYATSATRFINNGVAFAYQGLAGTNRTAYGNLGPNVFFTYTDSTAGLGLMVDAAGPITFATNSAEVARIDTSGNLNINGTANNGAKVNIYCTDNVSNALNVQVFSNGNNAVGFKNASGSQVGSIGINASTTSYNTSSDYRLKENIASMTGALVKVTQLKPVTYKWKVDGADGEGFIAHELAEVFPHAVTGEKDAVDADGNPKYQGIDTSFLVATLTSAIQELNTTITSLTERITALENK
jgi:hypothetical protein